MTVWLIVGATGEAAHIVYHVCATQQLAESYRDMMNRVGPNTYYVDSHEVKGS